MFCWKINIKLVFVEISWDFFLNDFYTVWMLQQLEELYLKAKC